MPNKNINKVIYGGRVLIDLTGDTVDPTCVQFVDRLSGFMAAISSAL